MADFSKLNDVDLSLAPTSTVREGVERQIEFTRRERWHNTLNAALNALLAPGVPFNNEDQPDAIDALSVAWELADRVHGPLGGHE